jgi:hypothetical protein
MGIMARIAWGEGAALTWEHENQVHMGNCMHWKAAALCGRKGNRAASASCMQEKACMAFLQWP